ncbi:hypothetical protein [Flaviaesturariibacter amylovorans]|uniref:CCDC81-like prokaryotic HU domain-containing protein n=1 Tax=Flaviaesturariibacter amylovorans TaxID=1084520 RepID=A0ABP8GYE9_9BACT
MLELLTQYLSRTRSLTIPHLGAFTLEAVPAQRNVVDQVILGPAFHVAVLPAQAVSEAQLNWLAGALSETERSAGERLQAFGQELQQQLHRGPFLWPGVGLLHWQDGSAQLQPATPPVLEAVAAGRVLREDVRHTVRQGEQEVQSALASDTLDAVPAKRGDLEWLAWLLVVLAALFVLYLLFKNDFSVHSTGLQVSATGPF